MLYKECPRCDGDVYLEESIDGREVVCLQCGLRRDVSAPRYVIAGDPAVTEVVRAAR